MNVEREEKYFNYRLEPGRKRTKDEMIIDKPLISIVTPYYNCKKYITKTANSIFNQTFPYWEWIIYNDGSTEEETEEILNELKNKDNRITIINGKNVGRIEARDNAIKASKTDLIFTLDSDDMIDKTMLETAYWSLMTNPEASWVYSDIANFDGKEFLWKQNFDSDVEKKENLMPVCALIRKDKLLDVGGYSVVDKDVHEDWALWLRMLAKGYFPIHMSYYAFWYRVKKEGGILASINNDKERDKHARKVIKQTADTIKEKVTAIQFPTSALYDYNTYPYVFDWDKPIISENNKIKLLFIFPWCKVGGADKFNYDLISNLDKEKFDITIITTEPCEYIWRQKFEECGEFFDLTTFLQRKDWASFMHYIIKTRHINLVMQSNSFYGYYALPWLKSEFPDVIFTDYIHNENWNWRNGEYPRESTALCRILDKTYVCNTNVARIMKEKMGRENDNMETVYIGVDSDEYNEDKVKLEDYPEVTKYKEKYENKKIVLFLARIAEIKRPILALRIIKKLLEKREDIVLFVVGDGPELEEMKKESNRLNISENIIFFGMQEDTKPFYKLADVLLICSFSEGLTITTYEAMSMKTPVVSANVGGQKELVSNECGVIVNNIQDSKKDFYNRDYSEEEIKRYAEGILKIIDNPDYNKIREICREKILNGFSIKNMIDKMDNEFTTLVANGTSINKEILKNKELFKQYLVMYNQADGRVYNSPEGGVGIDELNSSIDTQMLKARLWKNPLWRFMIKFLKKTGIMSFIKKRRIDRKVKDIVRKFA